MTDEEFVGSEAAEVYLARTEAGRPLSGAALAGLVQEYPALAGELRRVHADFLAADAALDDVDEIASAESSTNDRYEIRGEIARGGMGAVLEVWDSQLRRHLAMKVLRESSTDDGLRQARARSRLINEAQVLAQLEHPGIVPVHEVGEDAAGRPFFTMLRVRGRALDEIFDDAREELDGWGMTRAIGTLLRACEAVAHAHDRGVLHRDLKPSNVMVGPFGEVYVMDWGLAKASGSSVARKPDLADDTPPGGPTLDVSDVGDAAAAGADAAPADDSGDGGAAGRTPSDSVRTQRRDESDSRPDSPLLTMDGDVVGTPSYMAPEQAAGRIDDVDARSDVYGLGAILYRFLTGVAPYASADAGAERPPREILAAVVTGEAAVLARLKSVAYSAELVAICSRAMARDRGNRYQSVQELAQDLRSFLEGRIVQAHRTGAVIGFWKWTLRNRWAAAAAAIGCISLLLIVILQHRANRDISERAEALRRQVYVNDIALAQVAQSRDDIAEMQGLLAGCDADLRGWEWHCLSRLSDNSALTVPCGGVLAVDASGGIVAVAVPGREGLVRFFDLRDGAPVGEFETGVFVRSMAFDQKDRLLIGSNRGLLLVRELATGEVKRIDCGRAGRTGVDPVPSPNGELLAIARDSGAIDIWRGLDRATSERLDEGLRAFRTVDWSSDGRVLAGASWDHESYGSRKSRLRVYDMTTRELRHVLPGHGNWIENVAVSPDGRWVASGARDGRVLLWDLTAPVVEGKQLGSMHAMWPRVEWTTDGKYLLTAGSSRIELWDPVVRRVERSLVGLTAPVVDLAALADGRIVAASAAETRVWRLGDRESIHELQLAGSPQALAYSADGESLAIGFGEGRVEVWDLPQRRVERQYRVPWRHEKLALHPVSGNVVTIGGNGVLRVLDVRSEKVLASVQAHPRADLPNVGLAPDGRTLATCGANGVRAWRFPGLEPMWTVSLGLRTSWPQGGQSVVFDPSGGLIAVGAADGCLRVLAAESGRVTHELRASDRQLRYAFPVFSPDSRLVVAAVWDSPKRLVAWDLATGGVVWDVLASRGARAPRFSADGRRVLAASEGGALVVRDSANGATIVVLERGDALNLMDGAVASHASGLAIAGNDGRLRFWSGPR